MTWDPIPCATHAGRVDCACTKVRVTRLTNGTTRLSFENVDSALLVRTVNHYDLGPSFARQLALAILSDPGKDGAR